MLNRIVIKLYKLILYSFTLILAFCSAGFTILFYTANQEGIKQILIGLLAFTFEMLKVTLAFSYPKMKLRNYKIERSVKNTLNICLLLSICASVYFFLGQENVSPATKLIDLLYSYLEISIGKNFFAFILNMSLAIMIEIFIIKIPGYAYIFNFEKQENRSETIFEKIVSLPKFLIYSKINSLFQKYYKKLNSQPSTLESNIKIENYNPCKKNNSQPSTIENESLRIEEIKFVNPQPKNEKIRLDKDSCKKIENDRLLMSNSCLEGCDDKQNEGREVEAEKMVENKIEVEEKLRENNVKVENQNVGLRIEKNNYTFSTFEPEEIKIENFKNLIKNENDLLDVFEQIKDYDGFVNCKSSELQKKLGLTNWQLRIYKNKLKEKGYILIERNKVKVIKKVG